MPRARTQATNWAVTVPNPEHKSEHEWDAKLATIADLKYAIIGREHGQAPAAPDVSGAAVGASYSVGTYFCRRL